MKYRFGFSTILGAAVLSLFSLTSHASSHDGWQVVKPSSETPSSDIKIGEHRVTDDSTPDAKEKQRNHAVAKVRFILKLLKGAGTNSSDPWRTKKFPGTKTSIGHQIKIPGTDLGISTFYTRPNPKTEIWHVALSLDMSKAKSSPLTGVYQELTKFIGSPQYESLVVVASEDAGAVNINDLPAALKAQLDPFKGPKAPNNTKTLVVKFAKGTNFFASVKPPGDGPFKVMEQALLLGGKVSGGSLYISGSVGYDVLGKLLSEGKVETDEAAQQEAQKEVDANRAKDKEKSELPAVALKISYPSVIPAPFSFMDEKTAKKTFFLEIGKTTLGVQYDKVSNKLGLEAAQDVSLWFKDKKYDTTRKITFSKDKSDPEVSPRNQD